MKRVLLAISFAAVSALSGAAQQAPPPNHQVEKKTTASTSSLRQRAVDVLVTVTA